MTSILVVDDDEPFCRAIAEALIDAAYKTRQAHDENRLKAVCAVEPSDIVITDLFMPDCDGLEVIRYPRQTAYDVRIIAMSGADDSIANYLRAAMLFGAEVVLGKPFRRAELMNAVAACAPQAV